MNKVPEHSEKKYDIHLHTIRIVFNPIINLVIKNTRGKVDATNMLTS